MLFAEELAIVVEVSEACVKDVIHMYEQNEVQCVLIGKSRGNFGPEAQVSLYFSSYLTLRFPVSAS